MKRQTVFFGCISACAVTALFLMLCAFCTTSSQLTLPKPVKILVFSKTAGFHHGSIAVGNEAIIKLGAANGFSTDTTTNASKFTAENLKQYSAVIFLNTTGDVLNNDEQLAFQNYIEKGGGFVGVHSATDTEYDWPWYGNLVGAYFANHPVPQEAVLNIIDNNHPSTKHLPAQWKRTDEWYNFKWIADGLHILIKIDEGSYKGGTNGDNHPMAWYHSVGKGRAFYTELGHTDESYADPVYLQHLLGGIKYAAGKK